MSVAAIDLTGLSRDRDVSRRPSVLRAGLLPVVVAAATAEAFTLVARAAGVTMRAADPGASAAKAIPVGGIAIAVLGNAAAGLVVAALLARFVTSPARVFAAVATAYAALSLLGPAFATHTHTATKLVLLVAHLIAAVMVIPPVTRALAGRDR
jgi:D-alanyl-D-alanine carboxypeptidase